jgi:hypothetical protein
MNYSELFDKEAEVLKNVIAVDKDGSVSSKDVLAISKPTFMRICEELTPKWVKVEEFKDINRLVALSKGYELICSDGENCVIGRLLVVDKALFCDQINYLMSVKFIYELPPLPEK